MTTCAPASNLYRYSCWSTRDDSESLRESPYRRLTSPTLESKDSIGHAILNDELLVDDICLYDGTYEWLGRVMQVTQNYVLIMDWEGCFCRVPLSVGTTRLLARVDAGGYWSDCPAATSVAAVTGLLTQYAATHQAISLALKADYDPIDYDRWLLPLSMFLSSKTARLQPDAQRYYRWPAYVRRSFEATLELMPGTRQREVYIRNVLGGIPTGQLRREYGLGKAAIRTARWRAMIYLRQNMPYLCNQVG